MTGCNTRSGIIRSAPFFMALAMIVSGVFAASAAAQVSTTVLGTVKDAQGGVLPGATVLLVSETRGTKTEAVVTNGVGDFVIPNIVPDTYTLQVQMPSFQTLN